MLSGRGGFFFWRSDLFRDPRHQSIGFDRRRFYTERAERLRTRSDLVGHVAIAKEQHRKRLGLGAHAHLGQNLETVLTWQVEIEDDEARILALQDFESFARRTS